MLFHFKTIINKNVLVIHNMGFPGGSAGKESTCNAGDLGLIPGVVDISRQSRAYSKECTTLHCTWRGQPTTQAYFVGYSRLCHLHKDK